MNNFYTVLKHISGLALIFFTISLILVITDLENIANVGLYTWIMNSVLIIAFFIINKWCNNKIADEINV